MLRFAQEHASASNTRFVLTGGRELPFAENSVNAVFSTHVFQHFDSLADAAFVLREVHRVMAPGATLMIHLPVYRWPGTGRRAYNLWHRWKNLLHDTHAFHALILIRLGLWRPFMRGLWYETDWIFSQMDTLGFDRVETCVFAVKSNRALHSFIVATKV